MSSEFVPIRIVELEIDRPLIDLHTGFVSGCAVLSPLLVLVRLHGFPLGIIRAVPSAPVLPASTLAEIVQTELRQAIAEHLQRDGVHNAPPLSSKGFGIGDTSPCVNHLTNLLRDSPLASIIIATRNRTTQLAITLDSVLAQTYSHFEVIVVDNAPTTHETEEMLRLRYGHLPHVKYVREDRPGLASAHNTGVRHAQGTILAFTDDDVRVDRWWLASLIAALNSIGNTGCVTGLIMPAELETLAQIWFEQYSRFNRDMVTRIYDMAEYRPDNPLYPYAAGEFGSGANMAFRREALEAINGFDTAMGTGTPTCGGDDLAAFLDVILAGFRLVYEPTAIVWHQHPREYEDLYKRAFGYGVGLTAYLTRTFVRYPNHVVNMLGKLPRGIKHLFSIRASKRIDKPFHFSRELNRLELLGLLIGPFAYLKSRRKTRAWSSTNVQGNDAAYLESS